MKIGGFTIGGGYAMIPIIQHEVVERKKWITKETMTDYIALSQSIPGAIAINTSTAIGFKLHGILGAIIATLGMITPSVVIIMLIALVFSQLNQIALVQYAFFGIRAAVVALIFSAVLKLCKTSVQDFIQTLIFVITVIALLVFSVPPQYMILFGAISACLYGKIRRGGNSNATD